MSNDTDNSYPDNLAACPVCGEVASIDIAPRGHLVWCTFCGLSLDGQLNYESAIELWNRMSEGHEAPYAKER